MEKEEEPAEDRQPPQSTSTATAITNRLPTFQEYLVTRKQEVERIYGEIPDNYRGYELLMEIDDEEADDSPEIVTHSESCICYTCTD